MTLFNNKLNIMKSVKTVSNLKNETSLPTKVSEKPSAFEGVDGDKVLVQEGPNKYLYIKMGTWLKTKLNVSDLKTVNETSTTTTTDTTTTTTSSPTSTTFNVQYQQGTSADNIKGHSSYLIACKETESTGHTATVTTKHSSPDLSNGSTMYTTSNASTAWIPYENSSVLTASSNPDHQFFSMDGNPKSLFKVNYAGTISGVRPRVPSDLSVTGQALTSSSIRLTIAGNCQVTETVRIYYKTAAQSSFTEVTSTISTSNQVSDHSFTHDLTSLTANTVYNIKVRGENGGTQDTVGATSAVYNVTTLNSSSSWSVPNDFTISAFGFVGESTGEYAYAYKTGTIANGTSANNSTTISLTKDSGQALNFGVAISTTGDPGLGGTANNGTGYNTSHSFNLGTGTIYMRFRHQFREAWVGSDANISVTFSNTNSSLANNTDLDITMVNTTSGGG